MAQISPSPILHTPGGEMPDPSSVGQTMQRIRADVSVFGEPRKRAALVALLSVVAFGFFSYLLKRK